MSTVQGICGICQRDVQPIHRNYHGIAYCVACYARLFERAQCADCGHRYRYLRSEPCPPCPQCERHVRTCIRCGKPVPRASLIVDGGVACASCARYFKEPSECPLCHQPSFHLARDFKNGFDVPVCEKCRRQDHITCRVCGKHRRPAGLNQAGLLVCKHCLEHDGETFICPTCGQPGQPYSSTRCTNCYWLDMLQRRCREHRPLIRQDWARELFDDFVQGLSTRIGPNRAALRIPKYASFFVRLDAGCSDPATLSGAQLCELFSMDGLRRFATPFAYLVQAQAIPAVTREELEDANARQGWQKTVQGAEGKWYGGLLQRYLAYLEQLRKRYRDRGWTGSQTRYTAATITSALAAANVFLSSLEWVGAPTTQRLDQADVDAFLTERPGYRNPLRRFLFFLSRKERLFRPITIMTPPAAIPIDQILPDQQYLTLLSRWLHAQGRDTKVALLGALMLLYAQMPKRLVTIKLSDVEETGSGGMALRIGQTRINLEERAAALLKRYLVYREQELFDQQALSNDYLFPGRSGWSHFTSAGVTYQLNKHGVSAGQLFATAIYKAYQAGLRHPKVLVKAFGITVTTAVKYLNLLDPRLVAEVEAKLGQLNSGK
ncbi:MAG: hypothetical protein JNM11_10295 [Chitinimonas sp.]|nr:hypothetical protein [Chitinimonas sp.]